MNESAKSMLQHMKRLLHSILGRALDKREYLVIIRDNFSKFCIKHVVTPHLNRLNETVQMRGHTTYGFDEKLEKISSNSPSYLELC